MDSEGQLQREWGGHWQLMEEAQGALGDPEIQQEGLRPSPSSGIVDDPRQLRSQSILQSVSSRGQGRYTHTHTHRVGKPGFSNTPARPSSDIFGSTKWLGASFYLTGLWWELNKIWQVKYSAQSLRSRNKSKSLFSIIVVIAFSTLIK